MATENALPEDTDESKPPSNDDELFMRLKGWHKDATDHLMTWRKDAKEDYAFVAGDQWNNEDRTHLKDQMRPVITFNRVQPVIDSVTGMEVGNRQEVKCIPREITP